MTILTGNLATLVSSVAVLVLALCWSYKSGWLIRATYKQRIVGYLHSIASGTITGLLIWLIFFIHFRLH